MNDLPTQDKLSLPIGDDAPVQTQWDRRDMRIATVRTPPIPPDGVATILDFFAVRFPRQSAEVWRRRFDRGMVFSRQGPLQSDAPYPPLLDIRYVRELDQEWPVRSDYHIVDQNTRIMVVDKPPFLPVTPAGHYLENSLLHLLITATGRDALSPLHRLDKDASGLLIFALRPARRAYLHLMMRPPRCSLTKIFLAVCDTSQGPPLPPRCVLADCIARDPQAYHLQCVVPERPPNGYCSVERLEQAHGRALVRIRPDTGRKHQIRVQLAHAGWPIVNDRMYGLSPRHDPFDLSSPLLLTCHEIRIKKFPFPSLGTWSGAWTSRFHPTLSGVLEEESVRQE